MNIHLVDPSTGHHFTVTENEILLAGIGGVIRRPRTDIDRVLGAYLDAKDSDGDVRVGDIALVTNRESVRVILRGAHATIVIGPSDKLVSVTFNASAVRALFDALLDDEAAR
jgi:hypothetical protein